MKYSKDNGAKRREENLPYCCLDVWVCYPAMIQSLLLKTQESLPMVTFSSQKTIATLLAVICPQNWLIEGYGRSSEVFRGSTVSLDFASSSSWASVTLGIDYIGHYRHFPIFVPRDRNRKVQWRVGLIVVPVQYRVGLIVVQGTGNRKWG